VSCYIDPQGVVVILELSSCFHIIGVMCVELDQIVAHWFGIKWWHMVFFQFWLRVNFFLC
jgi:hypothetical protein